MTGLRKSQKMNFLISLYRKKGIEFDLKIVQDMSTTQLKKEILKIRAAKYQNK